MLLALVAGVLKSGVLQEALAELERLKNGVKCEEGDDPEQGVEETPRRIAEGGESWKEWESPPQATPRTRARVALRVTKGVKERESLVVLNKGEYDEKEIKRRAIALGMRASPLLSRQSSRYLSQ